MRILPGDPNKQSLRDRGLTFEMILEAIDSGGLLDVLPDAAHPGEFLRERLPTGEWVERAPYHEAVAVSGEGVFDTLKTVSKLVLKALD